MKRTILCLFICFLLLPFSGSFGSEDPTGFDLNALAEDSVYLADIENPAESVLGLERNADEKRYPASTTKIMSCILALENAEPGEQVTISKRACRLSEKNSKMGLKPGEVYPMIDLIYGMMLPSGNDAAIAVAEHIGGSVEGFADLMNEKAETIGMEHSHFMNPHGLHHDDHYSTARDMALLAAYAMQNETFREIVSTVEYTAKSAEGRKIKLRSSNRLLRDATAASYTPYSCLYTDAIGIKTGDTHLAGKCLVAAARKNQTTYILVLLHGKNAPAGVTGREKDAYTAQRFYDAAALFDYAFANDTVSVSVGDLMDRCLPETYSVDLDPAQYGAKAVLYRIDWDPDMQLTLPRWQANAFRTDPFPEDNLAYSVTSYNAPVGAKAGTVSIEFDGKVVFSADLITDEYDYPPTPEPTAEPTYFIIEETPETSLHPVPVQTEPPDFFSQFFGFLRCNPDD